jgi:hypothetical protein
LTCVLWYMWSKLIGCDLQFALCFILFLSKLKGWKSNFIIDLLQRTYDPMVTQ